MLTDAPAQEAVLNARVFAILTPALAVRLLPLLLLLTLPALAQAQFTYTTNDGTITITKYSGQDTVLNIPDTINGLTVTRIGPQAFKYKASLTSVTVPNSVTDIANLAFHSCINLTSIVIGKGVTSIGIGAFFMCSRLTNITIPDSVSSLGSDVFSSCASLTAVYFQGCAPYDVGLPLFDQYTHAILYYLPGTTCWDTFPVPTPVLWNPQVQTSDASFGVVANQFGFTIIGTANIPLVVEACQDLPNPIWSPVSTNVLIGGSLYFSDPNWTNYPVRLYRIRSP